MYDNLKLTEPGELMLRGVPEQFLERRDDNPRTVSSITIPSSYSAEGSIIIPARYIDCLYPAVTTYGEKVEDFYDVDLKPQLDIVECVTTDGVTVKMTPEKLVSDYRKFQQEFYKGTDLITGHSAYTIADAEVIEVPSALVSSQGYMSFREANQDMPIRFDQNVVNLHFQRGGMKGILPVTKSDFIGLPQVGSGETTSLDAELLNKTDRVKLRLTKPLYRVYECDGINDNEIVLTTDEVKSYFDDEMKKLKSFEPRKVAISTNDFLYENYHPKTGDMLAVMYEGDFWNRERTPEYGTLLVFRDDIEGIEYESESGFKIDRQATDKKDFLILNIAKPYFQVEDGNKIAIVSADDVEKYYKEREPELQNNVTQKKPKSEMVYLHDVSEKLIHPTSRKNVYSVSIADPDSSNGFGSILVHASKIYQKKDATGAPVPGKKSVQIGLSDKTVAYSVKDEFGAFVTSEVTPDFITDKWKEGRKAFFASIKGANEPKGYDKNDKEME